VAVLVAVAALPAWAAEPRLEWGPADGTWKVMTDVSSTGQLVSPSGSGIMRDGLARSFWGEGYGVGGGKDGPLVEFMVFDRPIRTKAECEKTIRPETRRHYNSLTCSETTFQGLRAIRWEGLMGGGGWVQSWIEVEVSATPPKCFLIVTEIRSTSPGSLARSKKRVADLLASFRIIVDAPPASVWQAEIRYPRNMKPGDVLSPTVVVTDQNGNQPSEPIQVSWLINGSWAHSVTWDGSPTELEVQVSVEGQAVVATTVVPQYRPAPTRVPTVPTQAQPPTQTPDQPPVVVARPPRPELSTDVPGLGGVGRVPGPRSLEEGVASVLGPAGIGLLGALLSGILGGGQTPPTAPEAPPQPPPAEPPKKKVRRRKKKAGERTPAPKKPEDPTAKPKKEPRPSKERLKKRMQEAEKAKKEAARAGSATGLLGLWSKNVKQDFKEAGETIDKTYDAAEKGLRYVAKRGAEEVRKAVANPEATLKKVVEGTKEAIETTARILKEAADKVNEVTFRAAKKLYDDPIGVLEKVKQLYKDQWKSFKDFITDPKKVWTAIKENTGISNFENCVDPNRSLLERIGQVGIGVLKLYSTITSVKAAGTQLKAVGGKLKNGVSTAIKRLRGVPGKRSIANSMKRAARRPRLPVARAPRKARLKAWKDRVKRKRALGGKASSVKPIKGAKPDLEDMSEWERKHIQMVADKHGVKIHVRPRGKRSLKLIKEGKALPKPECIKAKTVKPIDVELGFSEDSIGMVACKKPNPLPKYRPKGVSKRHWRKLRSRHAQRAQEFRDQSSKLDKLDMEGSIQWNRKTGMVKDKMSQKGFTGDHDMMAYTDPNGNPVGPTVRDAIGDDLMRGKNPDAPGFGASNHHEHMGWDTEDLSNVAKPGKRSPREIADGIKQKIIDGHAPGGEPLNTINPDGPPGMSYWEAG